MKLNIKLQCGVCDTNIWDNSGPKLKKSPEYNEVEVRMSDMSKMKVGVCNNHTKLSKLELMMIEEKTKQGWMEEVALGIGNKKWVVEKGSKLKVTGLI